MNGETTPPENVAVPEFPPGFDAYRAARERFFAVIREVEPEESEDRDAAGLQLV